MNSICSRLLSWILAGGCSITIALGADPEFVPTSLAPAGIFLTLDLPPGTQLGRSHSAAAVYLKGLDAEHGLLISKMDAKDCEERLADMRAKAKKPKADPALDEKDAVVVGTTQFGAKVYEVCVRIIAGEQTYLAQSTPHQGAIPKVTALILAKSAQAARQTESDLVAERNAIAACKRLDVYKIDGESMHLGGNLTDEDLVALKDIPYFKAVTFSGNFSGGALKKHLPKLTFLRNVWLEGPSAKDDWIAALPAGKPLSLDIRLTQINGDGLAPLKDQPQLLSLRIWQQPLDDDGLKHLAGLADLQSLDLSETGISDAGLAHLSGLKKLRDLNLRDTKITDAGLKHLRGLKLLQTLGAGKTMVTAAGAKAFQKLLPDCQVGLE